MYLVERQLRDRPFNLKGGVMVFCFAPKTFSDNTRVRIFILFSRKERNFFQKLTLDYMTKTLNQNIFLEKNIPPPPFKLNGRSLNYQKYKTEIPKGNQNP